MKNLSLSDLTSNKEPKLTVNINKQKEILLFIREKKKRKIKWKKESGFGGIICPFKFSYRKFLGQTEGWPVKRKIRD